MKNIFRFVGSLMCACALFTACSKDEPIIPEFPTSQVVKTVEAGEVVTISINPNLNWEASINEDEATYFQLLDGANAVYNVRGMAGNHDIKVQVADLIDMDKDHVCEVSLTMENQTKVIAVLTLGKVAREIAIYPVKVDEYGAFEYATDGDLTYAYESATVGENGVALTWPDGLNGFMGRVKVVSNFDWTVDGAPEWIKPIEGGKAGETELWIQADPTKYPEEASEATLSFVDVNNTEAVAATMKVSIPAAGDVLTVNGFAETSKFNAEGQFFHPMMGDYMDGTSNGYVTSTENIQLVALSFVEQWGMQNPSIDTEWVTLEMDEWDTAEDAGVIQERTLRVGVTANTGDARKAYVFVLPADVAADAYSIAEMEGGMPTGNIAEAYMPYLATTVEQEGVAATATLTCLNEFGDATLTQTKGGSWPYTDLGNAQEFYELLYSSEWADDDTTFNSAKEISNIYISILNANGNFVDAENDPEVSWVTYWKNGAGTSFKINVDPTHATAENALNVLTGDYEAGLYIEFADGTAAIIYLRYNENATAGGDGVSLAFSYPDYAVEMDGSSLVELTSGELYDMYSEYGAPVWHVTFTKVAHTMSMLTGISTEWIATLENELDAEWLSFEAGLEFQTVATTEAGKGKTGAIIFRDGSNVIKLVLLCTLDIVTE